MAKSGWNNHSTGVLAAGIIFLALGLVRGVVWTNQDGWFLSTPANDGSLEERIPTVLWLCFGFLSVLGGWLVMRMIESRGGSDGD
jgi:hypothetical protein